MAKDSERLLGKIKKRKIKENRASDESIGVYKSPSEFEKIHTTRKGKDGDRLLVKAIKRKRKLNRTSNESIGACESLFEFEKGPKAQKGKDGERLLAKAKKRKIKENRTSDESIGGVRESPFEFEKGPKTQKGKDGERLLAKSKKRRIKETRTSDESIGACESPSEFEKGPKTHKGNDGERLLVKAKKRKIKENRTNDESIGACESPSEFDKGPKTRKGQRSAKVDCWESSIHSETLNQIDSFMELEVIANESLTKTRKFKKDCKHKKKDLTNVKESNIEEVQRVVDDEKFDEISSVDDDCTRGMKKWLTQYKESRPGLEVLQQRIDEFVTAHEERLEQERKEREARAAEDGWTVVVHQKGRKKTTDAETGTAVGSVASAAVMDKMTKKKSKEIALDFYRFQKREAKRNEVMMLQSKFEQDKKRIQQLRAARKFRPS